MKDGILFLFVAYNCIMKNTSLQLCSVFHITVYHLANFLHTSSLLYNFDSYTIFILLKYRLLSFQACSSEVMMFRMARRYDVQSDSILFVNNQPYSRDSYSLAGMGETIEDLLHFCRTMYSMKVDNAEYALLTAIVIFSGKYRVWGAARFTTRTFVKVVVQMTSMINTV